MKKVIVNLTASAIIENDKDTEMLNNILSSLPLDNIDINFKIEDYEPKEM